MLETSKNMKLLKLLCFVTVATTLLGCQQEKTDPTVTVSPVINTKTLKFVQMMVFDDMKSAALGAEAQTKEAIALKNFGIGVRTTSKELASSYDENEVAADLKFKNNGFVLVSGKVEGILKDILGKPYVSLAGHKSFFGVQARFNEKDAYSLATLKKGQQVEIVCDISSKIVTQVILKDCLTFEEHASKVKPALDKSTEAALNGKQSISIDGANTIAFSYATGELLQGDACDQGKTSKCEAEIMAIVKKPENQSLIKSKIEEIKTKIQLQS